MSYCRFGEDDSDVYVFRTGSRGLGTLECCGCILGERSFYCQTEQQMIDHLHLHLAEGHLVPQKAFDRLEAERDGRPYETEVQAAMRNLRERGLFG